MKRLSIFIVLGLLLALQTSAAIFPRNLSVGSRGDDVMGLQEILITKGHLKLSQPTGYFGLLTKEALKIFQASSTPVIPSTGYFGPLSRAAAELALGDNTDEEGIALGAVATPEPKTTDDLVAQIKSLEQALKDAEAKRIQDQQQAQAALNAIQTNTTPPPAPAPVVEVDKSELVVRVASQSPFSPCPDCTHPQYDRSQVVFQTEALDKSGKKVNAFVNVSLPSDDLWTIVGRPADKYLALQQTSAKSGGDSPAEFYYYPTTKGSKTITFTSGNLSKTLIIEVK